MSAVIGVLGLGVMGKCLALNFAEKGFATAVYNRTYSKTEECLAEAQAEGHGAWKIHGYAELRDFVQALERPRRVLLMLSAGSAVDAVAEQLVPLMERGDIIIDGGNEWYKNTERRQKAMEAHGIMWVGMGVSGGEEGARHGPSMMPGGPRAAYEAIRPILKKCAAQVDDGPCVTYIGEGASGNYVKMVHNGIEYGDMQLLADSYALLSRLGGLSNAELHDVFKQWNEGELNSYLVSITGDVFARKDDLVDDGSYLVDKILDAAGNKGTGKWTTQEGAETGVPIPTISAALDARFVSAMKDLRMQAADILDGPDASSLPSIDRASLVEDIRQSLYAAKICAYAQGLHLLSVVSKEHNWGLNLGKISRIWKGGCIIRAVFLDRIKAAYDRNQGELASLLFDEEFSREVRERQAALRRVICLATQAGIPVPAFSASLSYYDALRSKRLPANLIQALRDYFGAHTYQRTDRSGTFHAEWLPQSGSS